MGKIEMIRKYGNEIVAYDCTDYYKPLVLCYVDEEYTLVYNVLKDSYSLLKVYHGEQDSYFNYNKRRMNLGNFVNVNSAWATGFCKTVEEFKKEMEA